MQHSLRDGQRDHCLPLDLGRAAAHRQRPCRGVHPLLASYLDGEQDRQLGQSVGRDRVVRAVASLAGRIAQQRFGQAGVALFPGQHAEHEAAQ